MSAREGVEISQEEMAVYEYLAQRLAEREGWPPEAEIVWGLGRDGKGQEWFLVKSPGGEQVWQQPKVDRPRILLMMAELIGKAGEGDELALAICKLYASGELGKDEIPPPGTPIH